MSYYCSNRSVNIPLTKSANGKFTDIDGLYNLLVTIGWEESTCFSKKQWNPTNKACGQCNGTALLVQEYFGGDIIAYPNPNNAKEMHFFNRIGGVDIDLTSDQFSPGLTGYGMQTKKSTLKSGRNAFSYEKSFRILQLKLGL